MVDAEKLRKRSGVGVVLLRGEHSVAETFVTAAEELSKERFVVAVGGAVQTEPARRERHRYACGADQQN